MKMKNLSVLAGLGGSLILTGSATAAYTGIKVVVKPNNFGIFVCQVYATFSGDAGDFIFAVAGTPMNPMGVSVKKGTFYQHALGSDRASSNALINIFPSLAYDTFVSIGRKRFNENEPDATLLSPGWPGFGPSDLPPIGNPGTNIGWFITQADPQGAPVGGQVLLGQFSTADGQGIAGGFLVSGFTGAAGDPFQSFETFDHQIPTPGALALLGMAGLISRRRRRRS